MTYADEAAKAGGEPIRIVELSLDYCGNTYGVAPCEAAIGVTGTTKCYHGFQTCQDQENFAKTQKVLRFWPAARPLPKLADLGLEVFPFLQTASIAATVLDPDHGIGPRGTVEIVLRDVVDDDALTDPYKAERAHDTSQGTFFGKLKARFGQSLLGRTVRVRDGFVKDPWDWSVFEDHLYTIDDFQGPDDRGVFILRASDPISRLKKKLYPAPSRAPLMADILSTDVSLNLQDVGGTVVAAAGTVVIGSELIDYGTRTVEADGTLTLSGLTRGAWGTQAADHKAAENVQQCGVFQKAKPTAVLHTFYQAGDADGFVTLANWQAEEAAWRPGVTLSHVVAKPTEIFTLAKQVAEQVGMFQWWDDVTQQVQLTAIAPPLFNSLPVPLTEGDTILAGTLRVDEGQRGQLTRIIVNYLPYDRINLGKAADYQARYVRINTETESANAYNRILELEVMAPWLRSQTDAINLALRKLARRGLGDNRIRFEIDKKDKQICRTGAVVAITHPSIQDATGARRQVNVRVLKQRLLDDTRLEIEATTSTYQTGSNPDEKVWVWQENDVAGLHYNDATPTQKLRAFWAENDGQVVPGVPGYRWY